MDGTATPLGGQSDSDSTVGAPHLYGRRAPASRGRGPMRGPRAARRGPPADTRTRRAAVWCGLVCVMVGYQHI